MNALNYAREFFDIPALIRNLFGNWKLIRKMTWQDFTARYRAAFGGMFWSLIQPLILTVTYTLVFSVFLRVRFGNDDSPMTYAVYLLCGIQPWTAFAETLARSTSTIRGNPNLVKKVIFPLEILPINITLEAVLRQVPAFLILIPLAWLVTGRLYWTLLLVPGILFLQILFTIGMSWIVSSLTAYLPDMNEIVPLGLRVWMFLTPLFYAAESVPRWAELIFQINPMARLVKLYRGAFMSGDTRSLVFWGISAGVSLLTFLIGYFWFMRTKRGFADVL